jgi:hypothetical protein
VLRNEEAREYSYTVWNARLGKKEMMCLNISELAFKRRMRMGIF